MDSQLRNNSSGTFFIRCITEYKVEEQARLLDWRLDSVESTDSARKCLFCH